MTLPSELKALRVELERLGYVVVEHSDHICVRFRMLSHVRVFLQGDRLQCDARFGLLPRARASALSFGVMTAIAAIHVALQGVSPTSLLYCGLAVLSAVYNLARYVSTENCITRVQVVWATRHGAPAWAPSPLHAGDERPALGEPAPQPIGTTRARTPESDRSR
jgi:hypothetical protein